MWEIAVHLSVAGDILNDVSLGCPFSDEMSWMRPGSVSKGFPTYFSVSKATV